MELTQKNVTETMQACLPQEGAIAEEEARKIAKGEQKSDKFVAVEGLVNSYLFDKDMIQEQKEDIRSMLSQLPEQFRKEKGGGWTFLNACNRQDGHQWGEHRDMESLFCLGIAAGMAKWLMPREMWKVFPGGVPYVEVDLNGGTHEPEKGKLVSQKGD